MYPSRITCFNRSESDKAVADLKAPGRVLLFLGNRSNHHDHPLAFELRHLLRTPIFLKFQSETQEKLLSLLRVDDGTSLEKDRRLDLRAFLQELLRVFEFELKVVLVRVRSEPDFLDDHLGGVRLHLLGFLLLLIEILLVVKNLAYWRIRLRTYLHQVKFEFISEFERFGRRVDSRLGDIVPNESDLRYSDLVIDSQAAFVLLLSWSRTALLRSWTLRARRWFKWCCDRFILLK